MVVANISDVRKDIKSYFATNYELSMQANEKRLDSAIEKMKTNNSFSKDLIEE